MTTQLLRACFCLLLTVALPAAGEGILVEGGLGYSLEIPADWEVIEGPGQWDPDNGGADFVAKLPDLRGEALYNIRVHVMQPPGELEEHFETDEEFIEMARDLLFVETTHADGTTEEHALDTRVDRLNGLPVLYFNYCVVEQALSECEYGFVVPGDEVVFIVMCGTRRANRGELEPIFQSIADSFEVTEEGAPRPIMTDDKDTMLLLVAIIGGLVLVFGGVVLYAVMSAKKKARKKAERKARLDRARGG